MDVKKEYFRLKEQWVKTRGSERDSAQQQLDLFFDSLTDEQKVMVQEAVSEDFKLIHQRIDEAKELKVRAQMEKILPIISVSYLAEHYFGKSKSWFFQRLNGNEVHGKIAKFTREEIAILNEALQDISRQIASLKVS